MKNKSIMQNIWKQYAPDKELTKKIEDIFYFIVKAIKRTRTDVHIKDVVYMVIDVSNEFNDIDIQVIKIGLKKGGLGYFGRTNNLSTQEICIWIREEIKYRKDFDENGNNIAHKRNVIF